MERAKIKTKIVLSDDLEQYKNEKMEELYADPLFLKWLEKNPLEKESVRASLGIFLDFMDDQHYCEKCPGLEKCQKRLPYRVVTPLISNGEVEKKIQMCDKMMERHHLEQRFIARDFPDEWLDNDLYNKENVDFVRTRLSILKCLASAIEDTLHKGVYLYGNTRVGKSYLLATFLVTYLRKHPKEKGAFIDSPTRFKELLDLSFQDKALFQQTLESYYEVDVLVLDDFGSGYMSDYIRDSIVYPIINQRLKMRKLTLFTSRFSLKQIETIFALKSLGGKIQAQQITDMIRASIEKEIPLEGISVY